MGVGEIQKNHINKDYENLENKQKHHTGVITKSNRLKDRLAEVNAQAIYESHVKTFVNTF